MAAPHMKVIQNCDDVLQMKYLRMQEVCTYWSRRESYTEVESVVIAKRNEA